MNKLIAQSAIIVPICAGMEGPGSTTDIEIRANLMNLKSKGIIGLMFNGGHDPETYNRVGEIAKEVGLEFHTWIRVFLWVEGKGGSSKESKFR